MKNLPLVLLGLLAIGHSGRAQDTLFTKHGEAIVAKVLKITPTEIEYRRFDNPDGPLIVALKSEVVAIRYANGTREAFEPAPTPTRMPAAEPAYPLPVARTALSEQELYALGRQDARLFYQGDGPMWGSAGASALFPPLGLVVGTLVAATPPQAPHFNAPDIRLLNEPMYVKGYRQQAHNRKLGKVAAGVGIGTGAFVVVVLPIIFLAAIFR